MCSYQEYPNHACANSTLNFGGTLSSNANTGGVMVGVMVTEMKGGDSNGNGNVVVKGRKNSILKSRYALLIIGNFYIYDVKYVYLFI